MQVRETVTSLASRFGQQSLHCTSGINLSNEDVPNKDILDNSSQSLHFFLAVSLSKNLYLWNEKGRRQSIK